MLSNRLLIYKHLQLLNIHIKKIGNSKFYFKMFYIFLSETNNYYFFC
jgi:hypothetical protein